MATGIMSLYSENSWSRLHSVSTKTRLHWILQGLGSVMALLGIVLEFIYRVKASKGHLETPHAIVGLVSGIFTLISLFNGMATLWSSKLKTYVKPVFLKCFHNCAGLLAFGLGMSWYFKHHSQEIWSIGGFKCLFFRNGVPVPWIRQKSSEETFGRNYSNVVADWDRYFDHFNSNWSCTVVHVASQYRLVAIF